MISMILHRISTLTVFGRSKKLNGIFRLFNFCMQILFFLDQSTKGLVGAKNIQLCIFGCTCSLNLQIVICTLPYKGAVFCLQDLSFISYFIFRIKNRSRAAISNVEKKKIFLINSYDQINYKNHR